MGRYTDDKGMLRTLEGEELAEAMARCGTYDLWQSLIIGERESDLALRCAVTVSYFSHWQEGLAYRECFNAMYLDVSAELDRRRASNLEQSRAEIKRTGTRELLRWLAFCRRYGGWYCPSDHKSFGAMGHRFDDIKAELATREHVPNKLEARADRRAAATMHRRNKLRP